MRASVVGMCAQCGTHTLLKCLQPELHLGGFMHGESTASIAVVLCRKQCMGMEKFTGSLEY